MQQLADSVFCLDLLLFLIRRLSFPYHLFILVLPLFATYLLCSISLSHPPFLFCYLFCFLLCFFMLYSAFYYRFQISFLIGPLFSSCSCLPLFAAYPLCSASLFSLSFPSTSSLLCFWLWSTFSIMFPIHLFSSLLLLLLFSLLLPLPRLPPCRQQALKKSHHSSRPLMILTIQQWVAKKQKLKTRRMCIRLPSNHHHPPFHPFTQHIPLFAHPIPLLSPRHHHVIMIAQTIRSSRRNLKIIQNGMLGSKNRNKRRDLLKLWWVARKLCAYVPDIHSFQWAMKPQARVFCSVMYILSCHCAVMCSCFSLCHGAATHSPKCS